jgi:hypothetical protein
MNAKQIVVEFKQKCPPYNPGEVAGFDPDVAQSLIERGVAVAADRKKAPAASPGGA